MQSWGVFISKKVGLERGGLQSKLEKDFYAYKSSKNNMHGLSASGAAR